MIKNIVFDLGRVLVDFYPMEYLNEFNFDEKTKTDLNNIIFGGIEWFEYDRGIYLHYSDIADELIKKYPKYSKEINQVLNKDWIKIHNVKEETAQFLKELKKSGKRVYILSNLSEDSYNYVTALNFFKYVDGGTYSYQINICKLDLKIYENLLNKYSLVPEETIFFDDKLENIEAANKLGIHGIQFTNISEVKKKTVKVLEKI